MISFRPYDAGKDYATVCAWWKDHGVPPVQADLLPRGWVAEATGLMLAVSFLYLDPGKIGVIEWTTTNPRCAMSPDIARSVRGLYEHLEREAIDAGCRAVMSFVRPGSWEHRALGKQGYGQIGGEHLLLAKFPQPQEAKCP